MCLFVPGASPPDTPSGAWRGVPVWGGFAGNSAGWWGGGAFGVGGVEVAHGGAGRDGEDAHEVDGICGGGGFVQDPVGTQVLCLDADGVEDPRDGGGGDSRVVD